MTKKYYWAIAVAAAFVAGTLTTGGVAYAGVDPCSNDPPQGVSDGRPFLEIWAAICDLQDQIDNNNIVIQTYQKNFSESIDPNGGTESISVECDPGDVATGGGFTNISDVDILTSLGINGDGIPATGTEVPVGWEIAAQNDDDTSHSVTSWVICQNITP